MLLLILVSLVLTVATDPEGPESLTVRTVQGPVKGYKHPKENFFAFYGIPYATAPTGPHKFKGPLPPPTWHDVLEATNKDIVCPQAKNFLQGYKKDGPYIMQEDCLIINVFVPDTDVTNLSVVAYVHGGGFQVGYGNLVKHQQLLSTGKVIVVNFNYRVGGHGFLCLGTEDVPGNAGMKDQVAALRWVKQNIAKFGGNPDEVSLAGYSAGAAAVELLMLSKSTRGLFNKVIPESGAGVGVWSVQPDPLALAKSYAKGQNFENVEDVYALEAFYKNLSFDILQTSDGTFIHQRDSTFVFVPCVEREGSDDAFQTEAPIDILKKGDYEKLPLLTGFADMEGIFRLNLFEAWKDDMNVNFSEFLPADLEFKNENERKNVAQNIKKFYFGKYAIDANTAVSFVNYFSDVMFAYPTYRSITLQSMAGSTALYWYQYAFVEPGQTPPFPGVTGANHCAQTNALGAFSHDLQSDNEEISEDYKRIRELLKDVWTNFIITSKPAPKGTLAEKVLGGEWPTTSPASPHYVLFNTTSKLRGKMWPKRMRFWDEIYSKYYRTPIPPPKPTKNTKSEL